MKNLYFLTLLLLALNFQAQKKNVNGKIYDKHPAINVANAFTEAFVSGDVEKIKNLVTDDFGWWAKNEMDPSKKDLTSLIERSKYLSKNIIGFEIVNNGGAYSDAMEFGKDKAVHVYAYQLMKGFDKNTGVGLEMPRNSIFFMNEDATKISSLVVSDSQLKWNKAYDAWSTRENGVIYKDHPMISKARLLYVHFAEGNLDVLRGMYKDDAKIRDVMTLSDIKNYFGPEEKMKMIEGFYTSYEVVNLKEIGYLDLLKYDGTDNTTIISWWEISIKNKKSGNISKGYHHNQITVNKEGLIVKEDYYWNPSLLPQ